MKFLQSEREVNSRLSILGDSRGFTLVEIVVVSALFIIVLMITGRAFDTIVTHAARLVKSEESHLEGIVGLELMRHDLEQAGFGLPWAFLSTPPVYLEATGFPASYFNGAANSIPSAITAGDNLGSSSTPAITSSSQVLAGTDYLVIRGTTVGTSPASRRWTYVTAGATVPRVWPAGNLEEKSRAIVIRRTFVDGAYTNQLIYDPNKNGSFSIQYAKAGISVPDAPTNGVDTYFMYGVASPGDEKNKVVPNLRMPFNRTDYVVKRPDSIPSTCAPQTGTLYKQVVNHGTGIQLSGESGGGTMESIPILDCVLDMQVVFGWDLNGDGAADAYSDASGVEVQGGARVDAILGSPAELREKLKLIKVYLLAQDGAMDRAYNAPSPVVQVGGATEANITRIVDLSKVIGATWRHYRWKRYQVTVRPKNLAGAWN